MRIVRGIFQVVGVLVLGLVLVGALWLGRAAWRAAAYEQVEDPADLARKAGELEWMREEAASASAPGPNIIVILFDDLGFGDLGSYGGRPLKTPAMDDLAKQGMAFDQYYSPAPVCTPSRAGLLTGRWPVRTSLGHVVFPTGHAIDWVLRANGLPVRLPADEITLAEALQAAGYATAAVGKWHLGDHSPSLPRDLGFDEYFGVLYSNDMSPLALYENEEIVSPAPVDQTTLTPRYTDQAVEFIQANRDEPFFLYMAHTFPHLPLYATAQQDGKSEAGLYGDVVADLDNSVRRVVETLDQLGLSENTLVVVTSDNGPWFQGSPGLVRGRKGGTFEGGMRVPLIVRWPGHVPAGQRTEAVAAGVDFFPTLLGVAGIPLPRDRVIDGVDLMPVFKAEAAEAEPRPILYYSDGELQAIRLGRFKWQDARRLAYGKLPGLPLFGSFERGPWLFDLEQDAQESYDVSEVHPEAFAELARLASDHKAALARSPRGWLGERRSAEGKLDLDR